MVPAYKTLLLENGDSWAAVSGAIHSSEQIGGQAAQNLTKLLLNVFERRNVRFATVLPAGFVREEILANVACQFGELRVYFADFERVLTDCTSSMEYDKQARFVGGHYRTLFTPAITHILAPEGGRAAGGSESESAPPACGGGCGSGSSAATSLAGKCILKAQSHGILFSDGAPPPAYF